MQRGYEFHARSGRADLDPPPVNLTIAYYEAATGRLRSKPFVPDNDAVRLLIAGRAMAPGSNRTWNHVSLKLADGATEIDRVSAPNSLAFVPVILDGGEFQGVTGLLQSQDNPNLAATCS